MPKGKLFLSGGGSAKDSEQLDHAFVASLRKRKIAYVPVAADLDAIGYEHYYDWIVGALSPYSSDFLDITMFLDLRNVTTEHIRDCDAIYLGGGNTYRLLQKMHESGFDEVLRNFHHHGGIIYGGSAGAIVLGRDLHAVKHENTDHYPFSSGIALLGEYSVLCHVDPQHLPEIPPSVTGNDRWIAIPEKSGVIVDNDQATVVGREPIFLIEKFQVLTSYNPGSRFNL